LPIGLRGAFSIGMDVIFVFVALYLFGSFMAEIIKVHGCLEATARALKTKTKAEARPAPLPTCIIVRG
jgi:hypothetical protein